MVMMKYCPIFSPPPPCPFVNTILFCLKRSWQGTHPILLVHPYLLWKLSIWAELESHLSSSLSLSLSLSPAMASSHVATSNLTAPFSSLGSMSEFRGDREE